MADIQLLGIGRRWSWSEDGADHCNGAGGFTGSGGELNNAAGYNGQGGGENTYSMSDIQLNTNLHFGASGGGGYYSKGIGYGNQRFNSGAVGGQGGWPWSGSDVSKDWEMWYVTRGGSRWWFWSWR